MTPQTSPPTWQREAEESGAALTALVGRGTVLLAGVVGAHAYGLAGPDSEVDWIAVFAAPTQDLLGLRPVEQTHHQAGVWRDLTAHEARKVAGLCLGCNPTVMELLWLRRYGVWNRLGEDLLAIREVFLCRRRVQDAYLGSAYVQLERLRGGHTPARAEKHARHLVRLCEQGVALYTTGRLPIRLPDPERVRALGWRVAEDPDRGRQVITEAENAIRADGCALSERSDHDRVEAWLQRVRDAHYTSPRPVGR